MEPLTQWDGEGYDMGDMTAGEGSVDWGGILGGLGSKALDIWAQRDEAGRQYREGRRIGAAAPVSQGNMLLLLIAAGVLFVMAKA